MTGHTPEDEARIRETIELSAESVRCGDEPFAALVVLDDHIEARAQNRVLRSGDRTRHAEFEALRSAIRRVGRERLAEATLYSSTEPCAMCTGALYWSGVGRLVYGASGAAFAEIAGAGLAVPCREILDRGRRSVEVVGPLLESSALAVHRYYWTKRGR